MKRIVAIALLIVSVTSFIVAGPVAASNRYWATGADIRISLVDENGNPVGDFSYPANTPFYIAHGFSDYPWTEIAPAERKAFMGPAMHFELWVDGVLQHSTMSVRNVPEWDVQFKMFVSEYDLGMTGTHVFEGKWYIDGWFFGETPGQAVLGMVCISTVTFA